MLLRWSICLRSLCTFWAHDGTRNMPSPGWMPPNVPAHVLKMAPMTRLMVVGQRASSAVQLQMPRLVCHSGWNIEFMVDRFRGRFGAAAVGFRRHLPPPAPPVLSHALGRSAELTRVDAPPYRGLCRYWLSPVHRSRGIQSRIKFYPIQKYRISHGPDRKHRIIHARTPYIM